MYLCTQIGQDLTQTILSLNFIRNIRSSLSIVKQDPLITSDAHLTHSNIHVVDLHAGQSENAKEKQQLNAISSQKFNAYTCRTVESFQNWLFKLLLQH